LVAKTESMEAETPDKTEILVWAKAFRASIQTHQNDFTFLMPWAALMTDTSLSDNIAMSLDVMPALEGLAAHCEAAIGRLTEYESISARNFDELKDAFHKSISAAQLLRH